MVDLKENNATSLVMGHERMFFARRIGRPIRRAVVAALLLAGAQAGVGYANEEISVQLPGGEEMVFVWIEPGTFTMGTTAEQMDLLRTVPKSVYEWIQHEQPAHEVTLTRGFYLGKYEVTKGQWSSVVSALDLRRLREPWQWEDLLRVDPKPKDPASHIPWVLAQEFIQHLNRAAEDSLFRLPTEAEWEYACRAGSRTVWPFGDDDGMLGEYAWYRETACPHRSCDFFREVGTKRPNAWGLHDMLGSMSEWVQDWYGPYSPESQTDPSGPPSGLETVLRGSSSHAPSWNVRPANRSYLALHNASNENGLRLVYRGSSPSTDVQPESFGRIKQGFVGPAKGPRE